VLSIVIPTYNRINSLKDCINSIVQQLSKGLEIIIINDGSTDSTVDYLKTITENYQHSIVVINNPANFGVNYSRNRGIEQATKEFILFLDSDDELAPGCLRHIISTIKSNSQKTHFLFLVSDRVHEFISLEQSRQIQYSDWINGAIEGDFIHLVASAIMKQYLFFEQFRMFEYLNWLRVKKLTAPQLLIPLIVSKRKRDRSDSLTRAGRLRHISVIQSKFEARQLYYYLYHKDLQHFRSKALTKTLLGAILLGVACKKKMECYRLIQYANNPAIKLAGLLLLLLPSLFIRKMIITWSAIK